MEIFPQVSTAAPSLNWGLSYVMPVGTDVDTVTLQDLLTKNLGIMCREQNAYRSGHGVQGNVYYYTSSPCTFLGSTGRNAYVPRIDPEMCTYEGYEYVASVSTSPYLDYTTYTESLPIRYSTGGMVPYMGGYITNSYSYPSGIKLKAGASVMFRSFYWSSGNTSLGDGGEIYILIRQGGDWNNTEDVVRVSTGSGMGGEAAQGSYSIPSNVQEVWGLRVIRKNPPTGTYRYRLFYAYIPWQGSTVLPVDDLPEECVLVSASPNILVKGFVLMPRDTSLFASMTTSFGTPIKDSFFVPSRNPNRIGSMLPTLRNIKHILSVKTEVQQ